MYKERTGGHNRSSTKEKRNTYPPLKYSPVLQWRRMPVLPVLVSSGARTRWGLFFVKTYKEYMKYETGWLHSGRNLRIIRKHV